MTDSSSMQRAGSSTLEDAGAAIRREGRQAAGEARATARKLVGDQRDALADYVSALADAANRGADELDSKGYGRTASAVAHTADEAEGLARRLSQREPGELWEDVEDFTREHPALVFGAGFVLAFGVTRFLKSSDEGGAVADRGTGEDSGTAAASAYSEVTPPMSDGRD